LPSCALAVFSAINPVWLTASQSWFTVFT